MSTYDNTLDITRQPSSQVSAAHRTPMQSFVMIRCRCDHSSSKVCQHIFALKLALTTSHRVRTVAADDCLHTTDMTRTKLAYTNSEYTPGNNKHSLINHYVWCASHLHFVIMNFSKTTQLSYDPWTL